MTKYLPFGKLLVDEHFIKFKIQNFKFKIIHRSPYNYTLNNPEISFIEVIL